MSRQGNQDVRGCGKSCPREIIGRPEVFTSASGAAGGWGCCLSCLVPVLESRTRPKRGVKK